MEDEAHTLSSLRLSFIRSMPVELLLVMCCRCFGVLAVTELLEVHAEEGVEET